MYKLKGALKLINDTVQVSEKFAKREFVITDNDAMYPQDILFQAVQDKCSMLDGYSVGDQVEVSFNLRGKAWQKDPSSEVKYFNSLDAWRIEKLSQAPNAQPLPQDMQSDSDDDDFDGLPF